MEYVPSRFIEVGRIGKPRGLDGIVRVIPSTQFPGHLFSRIPLLYWRNSRSDFIPARIEDVRTENKRNHQTFFVKFDLITGRDNAEKAMDKALFVDRDVLQNIGFEFEIEANEDITMYGYSVWYNHKKAGEVLDIMKNPAHPIMEVKYGVGTILIPMVDEYVKSIDHSKKTITCINLDRLTDI